jgi:peroxin-11B
MSRDPLIEFVEFVNKTSGQEKLCRLLQYGSKIFKWLERHDKTQVERWTAFSTSMGMARKIIRFGKSIEIILNLTGKNGIRTFDGTVLKALELLGKFCLLMYFLFDHVIYVHKLKLLPVPEKLANRVAKLSDSAWMGDIVCGVSKSLIELSYSQGMSIDKKNTVYRNLVRNLLDFPVASHFLGLEWTKPIPEIVFGVCGATTSLVSFYDMWPTPPATLKKQ